VLGVNAPYPFQQNSLSQKIEWDGLKDDFSKADPAGCKVRVSLGLKAGFERSMLWDPYFHEGFETLQGKNSAEELNTIKGKAIVAEGKDGTQYVVSESGRIRGIAYDKDGKYLRTFFPPPAAEIEKLMGAQGWKFATTAWGDKVAIADKYGPFTGNSAAHLPYRSPIMVQLADAVAALKAQPGVGEVKIGPLPKLPQWAFYYEAKAGPKTVPHSHAEVFGNKNHRMAADRVHEEIYYQGRRLDGKTGEMDKTWPGIGGTECAVGPDGHYYVAVGPNGYAWWIARFDHGGKLVGFTGDGAVVQPGGNTWGPEKEIYGEDRAGKICGWWGKPGAMSGDGKILYTGSTGHSNTHERGFCVSPNGKIVIGLLFQSAKEHSAWAIKHGLPKDQKTGKLTVAAVWDKDGNYITANALGDTRNGHNVFMDRDGNMYAAVRDTFKRTGPRLESPDGIKDPNLGGSWGEFAGLVKFRWEGKFPLAELDPKGGKGVETQKNALWVYKGIPNQTEDCACHNTRCDMDCWARIWVPSNQLCSVTVLDSNGNRVARIGRYGNVDDADPKCGRIHFAWMRSLCVSDTALYVADTANQRVLKAALSYAAEETVPLP
jgi:hypothetical protein